MHKTMMSNSMKTLVNPSDVAWLWVWFNFEAHPLNN